MDVAKVHPVISGTGRLAGHHFQQRSQVAALQKIVMLRDMNFQIAEIRKALRYWSDETLREELNRKIQEKQNHIIKEQQQIQNLRSAIESINKKQLDLHYRIIIREVPSRHVISYRKRIPDYSCEKELWNELYCFIKENHIEISRQNDNNITIFHENKESDSGVDAEVCLRLPPACPGYYSLFILPCVRLLCADGCADGPVFQARLQVVMDVYAIRPEPCMLRRQEPACPDLPLYPPPIRPGPPCWPQCPAAPDPCGWPARG